MMDEKKLEEMLNSEMEWVSVKEKVSPEMSEKLDKFASEMEHVGEALNSSKFSQPFKDSRIRIDISEKESTATIQAPGGEPMKVPIDNLDSEIIRSIKQVTELMQGLFDEMFIIGVGEAEEAEETPAAEAQAPTGTVDAISMMWDGNWSANSWASNEVKLDERFASLMDKLKAMDVEEAAEKIEVSPEAVERAKAEMKKIVADSKKATLKPDLSIRPGPLPQVVQNENSTDVGIESGLGS